MLRHVLQRLKLIAKLKVCPDNKVVPMYACKRWVQQKVFIEDVIPMIISEFQSPLYTGLHQGLCTCLSDAKDVIV